MPREQVLSRTTFNTRVATALRLLQEKRAEAMSPPPPPGGAPMRMLKQSEFEVAWQAMKDTFSAIWCKDAESTRTTRKPTARLGLSGADTPAKLLGTATRLPE